MRMVHFWYCSVLFFAREERKPDMGRIENTVFISYRRTNLPWALAVSQNLSRYGYDVFLDFNGIASGDFESVILGNIRARAHFLVLLTPSALERCGEAGDWLRREIEAALELRRNIVPLTLEGFDFSTPAISGQLPGTLAALKSYNALSVPAGYFDEAMERLRQRYLNIALDTVLHPASVSAARAAKVEQAAAIAAPTVSQRELTAQEWFERGVNTSDHDEELRFFSEAIRLEPDFAEAFYNRGLARGAKGDFDGAIEDYIDAIRLKPDLAEAYNSRGLARRAKGDLDAALQDYNEAIRLKPDSASAFNNRGAAQWAKGDLESAIKDYKEAIRLNPNYAEAYYNRALIWKQKGQIVAAIADYQQYLDVGGDVRYGDTERVKQTIREFKKKLRGRH